MSALALPAEQAEELDRLGVGGAEPVGYAGVELGRLARRPHQIAVTEDEPQATVQDMVIDAGAPRNAAATGVHGFLSRTGSRRPNCWSHINADLVAEETSKAVAASALRASWRHDTSATASAGRES